MAPAFACEPRGEIEIKGLGPTETWLLLDPRAALPSSPMN
jgi:hypothetical protein